ncbi:MAG: hypothetical protein ACRCX2_27195 [Paraclostridium sp.]
MAGVKGQKSGGFGGRKKLPSELRKTERITFRCTLEEKEKIEKAREDLSLVDFIFKNIKEDENGL